MYYIFKIRKTLKFILAILVFLSVPSNLGLFRGNAILGIDLLVVAVVLMILVARILPGTIL